jgi:hypothetical protein
MFTRLMKLVIMSVLDVDLLTDCISDRGFLFS